MSMTPSTRFPLVLGAVALLVVGAACSGDAAQSGVTLIEGELATQIGLGALEATCDQPSEAKEGETFSCSATTESGAVIEFTSVFEADDEIYIYPTNLVVDSSLFEQEAAETLGPELGIVIDPAQIECPEATVVLDPARRMECAITDAASGDRFLMVATLGDYVRDQGFENRFYEIGDALS